MTEEAKKWLREGMKKGFCSYEWCETHNPIVLVDNNDKCFVVVQIFDSKEKV
jgi:hypothetical protein